MNVKPYHFVVVLMLIGIAIIVYLFLSYEEPAPKISNNESEYGVITETIQNLSMVRKQLLLNDETYNCMAIAANDANFCFKSADRIDNCLADFYVKKAIYYNEDECQSIPEADFRRIICDSIISKDTGKCGQINRSDDVLVCKAFSLLDDSFCADITDEELARMCYSRIKTIELIDSNNALGCSGFYSEESCVAVVKEDPDLCVNHILSTVQVLNPLICQENRQNLNVFEKRICDDWVD